MDNPFLELDSQAAALYSAGPRRVMRAKSPRYTRALTLVVSRLGTGDV
jgi:hypothetical protein